MRLGKGDCVDVVHKRRGRPKNSASITKPTQAEQPSPPPKWTKASYYLPEIHKKVGRRRCDESGVIMDPFWGSMNRCIDIDDQLH